MFEVGYENRDGNFHLTITNRKGRKWVKTVAEGDLGNAAEAAMVLQEYLDGGNVIKAKEYWSEAA